MDKNAQGGHKGLFKCPIDMLKFTNVVLLSLDFLSR